MIRGQSKVLPSGYSIPVVGLGTWQIPDAAVEPVVASALKLGYRHIDTAKIYQNEEGIGRAIARSGIPREQLFITTKLWNSDHKDPRKALVASLQKLGLTYVDLYLIHWPVEGKRQASWKVLEQLQKEGLVRSIGVSNYTVRHLQELLSTATVRPAVNQVELSPFLYQQELLEYCAKERIVVEAYSPLTRGEKLRDARLLAIAKRWKKSPAQVVLRWGIEKGLVVLPKATGEEHQRENFDVFNFSLSPDDHKMLDAMNEGFRTCWDPETVK